MSEGNPSDDNQWTQPASESCYILKWIGIYLCFVFILGVVLNGSVIYILTNKKYPRSPISVFIIALSTADLSHALLGIPLPLTSNLACRWLYGKYMCYYEGFIAYFVGMIGLYLLTALSLNRYWMIVSPVRSQYVTFHTAYVSVLLSILGSLFWAGAPILGWNNYALEGVLTSCSVRWQDRTMNVISYNIFMFIFAYVVPLIVMLYCNIKIYLEVRVVSQRRLTWSKGITTPRTSQKGNIDQHMAKTVFFIILTFTTAWTPYAIVAFISSFISPDLITPLGGTLPAIFAKSSICFNPLVYIMTNAQIRSQLFGWQRKKVHKTNDSTSTKDKNDPSNSPQLENLNPSCQNKSMMIIRD